MTLSESLSQQTSVNSNAVIYLSQRLVRLQRSFVGRGVSVSLGTASAYLDVHSLVGLHSHATKDCQLKQAGKPKRRYKRPAGTEQKRGFVVSLWQLNAGCKRERQEQFVWDERDL